VIFFLRLFGTFLAHLPKPALQALVAFSGEAIFLLGRRRRRTLLANLRHAFPERDHRWVVSTGRESVRQMVEFGLLAVALPCFSEQRLRQIFSLSPESHQFLRERAAAGSPAVILAPHLGPQEGLTLLPLLFPEMPPCGGIYRPLNNEAVDTWIRESRERFGVTLFSRKRGLQNAIRLLRANQWLGLLFDQNSSKQGALITFLDRVASVTELPGILASRHDAAIILLYTARRGFWQVELRAGPGPVRCGRNEINFAIHLWLEELLRNNEELLPSWLWAHNRWRHQRVPQLCLRRRKNLIAAQNAFLGRDAVPRREPFFIRLPDAREEVLLLLPLLRSIRCSRPDAALTVIGKAKLLPLVRDEGLCEKAVALPEGGPGYFFRFWRLRREFPSAYFLFTDSLRGDFEAWLTGAPHRFGIEQPGKRRLLVNRPWRLPADLAQAAGDTSAIWEGFLRAQGLDDPAGIDSPEEEEPDEAE
jgi:heptosyltransferase II